MKRAQRWSQVDQRYCKMVASEGSGSKLMHRSSPTLPHASSYIGHQLITKSAHDMPVPQGLTQPDREPRAMVRVLHLCSEPTSIQLKYGSWVPEDINAVVDQEPGVCAYCSWGPFPFPSRSRTLGNITLQLVESLPT